MSGQDAPTTIWTISARSISSLHGSHIPLHMAQYQFRPM